MGNEQLNSGLMVGMIAASIDVVTNWLGDLKDGFCRPSFYLSKAFCCWQIDGREEKQSVIVYMTSNFGM